MSHRLYEREDPPVRRVQDSYPDEMPRERLIQHGAEVLKNAELIAILLRTGVRGEAVFDLSERLLREHGGLVGLQRMDLHELLAIKGFGEAKATTLKAALEIGRRLALVPLDERPSIESPEDVAQLYSVEMSALEQEQIRVVLLDTRNRIIETRMIYQGNAHTANVRIGELFRDAVRRNAVSVILMHNHPSGDPTPSSADVALTAEVAAAGKILDIPIVDHLIIAGGKYVSLKRLGLGFPRSK